jgi:micrococcal nuclease
MGTRAPATILRVIDGDTLLVKIAGAVQTVRALCCDTEESHAELKSKPVTNAGVMGGEFGRQYWWNHQPVLEFESDDSLENCLQTQRDYFNRLRCYLWRDEENYNLKLVEEGLTPYFRKYGSSLYYHQQFISAMELAQFNQAGIWNRDADDPEIAPNYIRLLPLWNIRGSIVDQYRVYAARTGVPPVYDATGNCDNACHLIRQISHKKTLLSYKTINKHKTNIKQTQTQTQTQTTDIDEDTDKDIDDYLLTLFCDLQGGIRQRFKRNIIYRTGTKASFIRLITDSEDAAIFLEKYSGVSGKGYVYIRGLPSVYRGFPQIEIKEVSDRPSFDNPFIVESGSQALRNKILQDVRYAARSAIKRKNASRQ